MNSFTSKQYVPFILIIISFGVYLSTTCPTVYLGDSGEITAAAFSLGIPHNSGYPLYALLGKLFCLIPMGNMGFRMNLMSTFFSVLTVWLVYSFILRITASSLSALVGSLILAFIPILWLQTVCAEVYPLHTFFVALLIRLLLWWDEKKYLFRLVLLVFVTGISFGNHMQTVMLAPAVLFIIISGDKRTLFNLKHILILSVFFVLALSIYLYLPIRTDAGAAMHWGDPNTLGRFLEHVTARAHREGYVLTMTPSEYLLRVKETFWIIGSQFGVILLLAIWGFLNWSSIRWRIFFVAVIIFDFIYTIFLNTISLEITVFTLPTCIVLAILTGMGISKILKITHFSSNINPKINKILKIGCLIVPGLQFILNFGLCDQSRNYTAYEHALNIFRTVDNGSTLFIDGDNNVFPVTYMRIVERMREDVTLYDRHNLFFKMPYLGENREYFYGKWRDLRTILEKGIIENVANNIYFAVFNPFSIALSDKFTLVPFGILDQVLENKAFLNHRRANKIWDYYSVESFYDNFEKDYMNRAVNAYFHFSKGKHFFMIGVPKVGLEYLRLASQIGYNDDMIHSDIAVFLTDYEFFEEARLELEKALIYNDDPSGIHNNWGYYYYKIKGYYSAIASFRKAVKLNPKNHVYINNLGFSLLALGKKKEAFIAFQKSLAINGNQTKIKEIMKDHYSE
ncbi:MAG: DUF2723 domain-containing protein [Deltaproteobacteria bacterium]|nr:DUF2723 domain-containing protein [Deltaproteobacteria bacterium]